MGGGQKAPQRFYAVHPCLDFLNTARTLSPLSKWGLEGSEKLKNFLKVTQENETGA